MNNEDLRQAEELKKKRSEIVMIRDPKTGGIMSVSPSVANILLRKNAGYRRVSAPPPIDVLGLNREDGDEK